MSGIPQCLLYRYYIISFRLRTDARHYIPQNNVSGFVILFQCFQCNVFYHSPREKKIAHILPRILQHSLTNQNSLKSIRCHFRDIKVETREEEEEEEVIVFSLSEANRGKDTHSFHLSIGRMVDKGGKEETFRYRGEGGKRGKGTFCFTTR